MTEVWPPRLVALTSVEDETMSESIRAQFVRDMQVAGFAPESQRRYLTSASGFFKTTWLAPQAVREQDVQDFLISLRDKNVARETFRGYRYALQFLFVNTLGRDWVLLKKTSGTRAKAFAQGLSPDFSPDLR